MRPRALLLWRQCERARLAGTACAAELAWRADGSGRARGRWTGARERASRRVPWRTRGAARRPPSARATSPAAAADVRRSRAAAAGDAARSADSRQRLRVRRHRPSCAWLAARETILPEAASDVPRALARPSSGRARAMRARLRPRARPARGPRSPPSPRARAPHTRTHTHTPRRQPPQHAPPRCYRDTVIDITFIDTRYSNCPKSKSASEPLAGVASIGVRGEQFDSSSGRQPSPRSLGGRGAGPRAEEAPPTRRRACVDGKNTMLELMRIQMRCARCRAEMSILTACEWNVKLNVCVTTDLLSHGCAQRRVWCASNIRRVLARVEKYGRCEAVRRPQTSAASSGAPIRLARAWSRSPCPGWSQLIAHARSLFSIDDWEGDSRIPSGPAAAQGPTYRTRTLPLPFAGRILPDGRCGIGTIQLAIDVRYYIRIGCRPDGPLVVLA